MSLAFVIQPFDGGGPYDKRYTEIICPILEELGLKPYRVDRDPSAKVLIETIKRRIAEAEIVICEITENNPNVWFELGFAFALQKECFMLCSKDRPNLPFDVQHEMVLFYKKDSPSDFDEFQERLRNCIRSRAQSDGSVLSPGGVNGFTPKPGLPTCPSAVKGVIELPDDTPF